MATILVAQVKRGDELEVTLNDGTTIKGIVEIVSDKSIAVQTSAKLTIISLRNLPQDRWDEIFGTDNEHVKSERERLRWQQIDTTKKALQAQQEKERLALEEQRKQVESEIETKVAAIRTLFANPLELEKKIASLNYGWAAKIPQWKESRNQANAQTNNDNYRSTLSIDTTQAQGISEIECLLSSEGKGNKVSLLRLTAFHGDFKIADNGIEAVRERASGIFERLTKDIFRHLNLKPSTNLRDTKIDMGGLKARYYCQKTKGNQNLPMYRIGVIETIEIALDCPFPKINETNTISDPSEAPIRVGNFVSTDTANEIMRRIIQKQRDAQTSDDYLDVAEMWLDWGEQFKKEMQDLEDSLEETE